MDYVLNVSQYGAQLWTREKARIIRGEVEKLLEQAQTGDSVVINLKDVEVFDYSFANELFGMSVLRLSKEYPEKFLVVENLTNYTRENLSKALESLGLIMIERKGGKLQLLGKIHPADQETFHAIESAREPVTAVALKDKLGINLTAVNERLTKLSGLSIIRRKAGVSEAGRQQYEYTVLK